MASQKRILIIGASGFVGGHLISDLKVRFGDAADIVASSRDGEGGLTALDLTDEAALRNTLQHLRPTHVINLAGIAAPALAAQTPQLAWSLHAIAPERLGRLILEIAPECWLLHVGSAFIYGRTAIDMSPINETAPLEPMDLYGVTKAAGDLALGMLSGEGLRCLRLRPFNHTGPGQSTGFAIPSFAAQIAQIEAGQQPAIIKTGNLDAIRDFLDVRDVVAAYGALIAQTDHLSPGSVLNIASGIGWKMSSLLNVLLTKSHVKIKVASDRARQRKSDLPRLIGNASALRHAISWSPTYDIHHTLQDTLDHCRRHLPHSNTPIAGLS